MSMDYYHRIKGSYNQIIANHIYQKSALILLIASPLHTEDIIVENLTPHQLHTALYNISSEKRTDAGVRIVPPSGQTKIPSASSSFFPTITTFVLAGARDAVQLTEQQKLIPYAYAVINSSIAGIGKKTKRVFLQELGDDIGATTEENTDTITVINTTQDTIEVALYYDDDATAYRWGKPISIAPSAKATLQRPEAKCLQKQLGVCTKYYDRNVYFSLSGTDLSPIIKHKQIPYVNVGGLKGKTFVIYDLNGTLKGSLELTWKAHKGVRTATRVLKPNEKKVKDKYEALDYPGKNQNATVRESSALSDQETAFRLKRTAEYVRPACKAIYKKIYNKELPDNVPTPTVALCVSGGGCRAMFTLAGLLAAAEQKKFLPYLTYIATLSGSTWALASWLYYNKSAREHVQYLCKQFTSGIWTDFDILQIQEAVLRKQAYGQPTSIIDIYGALLGDKLFKSYAPHRNPNELFWGTPLPKVVSAEAPYPLYSAVTPRNFSDLVLTGNPFEYYHWITFDPYEVSITDKSIPSWAFGRVFSNNVAAPGVPPCSAGYLLGIFGSAMSINTQDVGNVVLRSIQPQYADDLINITSKNKTLSLLMQQRASPAKVPNFLADGLMTMVDAGMDLIFPFPPLLKRERTVDIIISIDGSAGIKLAPGLRGFQSFLKKQNIDFPEIDLSTIGKTPHSIVWDKQKIDAPMLIHIPLINHKGYENNWDPETSLWSNTMNFVYSEANAKKLTGLSEYMFNEAHEAIERAIAEWLQEHANHTVGVPPGEPAS